MSTKNIFTDCKIGQGHDCCRYLTVGPNGFTCEKLSSLRPILDARDNSMTAQGDNCEGTAEVLDETKP